MIEDNKALVRRAYLDGMNMRNMDVIEEVFSPTMFPTFLASLRLVVSSRLKRS
jgi:hypothetical protein